MPNNYETENSEIGNRQSAVGNAQSPFGILRRFIRQRTIVERCEMCSAEVAADHEHLMETSTRLLVCACQACVILFSGNANARYRRVPRRILYLSNFQLSDAQWESLLIPINLAFFFHSGPAEKVVALYPSPAGATESLLDFEAWTEIVQDNPVLLEMEPDTEALLVNRIRGMAECYLLPIDECYRLVGLIRTHWHGLSGGTQMWEAIEKFFVDLKARSTSSQPEDTPAHAREAENA